MAQFDVVAKLRADTAEFVKGMKSGQLASTNFATSLGGLGNAVTVGLAASVAVAGIALYKLGQSFHDAYKEIRVTTGKTGEELHGLEQSFKNVFAQTPASMKDVSTAISDVSVKLGLTGKPLEDLSLQLIKLSRITGTDLKADIESVTMVFKNFGVSAADQKDKLDLLYRASQNSGVAVSQLANDMSASGLVLRTLGFDFDSSAALIGTFAKAGISAGDVMPGLQKAVMTAGKASRDAKAMFSDLFDRMRKSPDDANVAAEAMKVFGRSAPKMVAAIKEGKLNYDEFMNVIQSGTDTIAKSSADVSTFGGKMTILSHELMLAFEPLATTVFSGMNSAMKAMMPVFESVIGVVRSFVDAFRSLPGPVQAIIPVLAAVVLGMKALMVIKTISMAMSATFIQGFAAMSRAAGTFVFEFIASMTGAEGAAVVAGSIIEAALGPVMIALALGFVAFTMFTQASRDSEKAQKEYKDTLDKTTGAITDQSKELTLNKLEHEKVLAKMNEAGISMDKVTGFIQAHNAERVKQGQLEHMWRMAMEESRISVEKGEAARQKYAEQLRNMGGANNELLASLMEIDGLNQDVINTLYDEADAYEKKQKELEAVTIATNIANGMTKEAAIAANDAKIANDAQAKSIQGVIDAQHAATDPVFAALKAQSDLAKAQKDYNEKLAAGNLTEQDRIDNTIAYAQAAAASKEAIMKLDIAQLSGQTSTDKFQAALYGLTQYGFKPTAEDVRLLRDRVLGLDTDVDKLRTPIEAAQTTIAKMTAEGLQPGDEAARLFTEKLRDLGFVADSINGKTVAVKIDVNDANFWNSAAAIDAWFMTEPGITALAGAVGYTGKITRGLDGHFYGDNGVLLRATGGPVDGSSPYIVGERGPEMFIPNGVSGKIIPNNVLAGMGSGSGGGDTYNVTINTVAGDPAAIERVVIDALARANRRGVTALKP